MEEVREEGAASPVFEAETGPGVRTAALRPLKPADVFWRGLYGVRRDGSHYVVEVDFFDIGEKVRLYRDGRLVGERPSPARFQLEGHAAIEASMALYGMKRAHLVEEGHGARALEPLPGTAEARRLAFDARYPGISRAIAVVAWVVLAVAAVTQVPNMLNSLANGAAWLGVPVSFAVPTFALPAWLNVFLGAAGIVAGLDRGLRMVHNPLLDD